LHQIFSKVKILYRKYGKGDGMPALEVTLHDFIEKHNVLARPTMKIQNWRMENPNLYAVVLLANHVFRAVSMFALSKVLIFPTPINFAICFAGSLFYRLTVEVNCAYKFALPAFAGSIAIASVHEMVHGVAFASLSESSRAFFFLAPLVAYASYICLTVSYDLDHS
jgi:hypothetical protein